MIYSGIYMGNGLVNTPKGSTEWFHIEVIRHNDIYTVQKAYFFTDGTCPVYIRTQTNGTWNGWRLFNPGTANTAQVLSGYTFSSANGVNLSGSMPNNGALNWSGICTTYTVAAGYYSGGTLDSRPSYNRGVTDADNRANGNSTNYKTGYNNGYNAGKAAAYLSTLINTTGVTNTSRTHTAGTIAANTGTEYIILTSVTRGNSTAASLAFTLSTSYGTLTEIYYHNATSGSHRLTKLVKASAGTASTITMNVGRTDAYCAIVVIRIA